MNVHDTKFSRNIGNDAKREGENQRAYLHKEQV